MLVERVAIFAALRWECGPILRHLRRVEPGRVAECAFWRGEAPGREAPRREIWLIKTAMGEQHAAAAGQIVEQAGRLDLLLSTGCAGALSPELASGDLAIATAVIGDASRDRYETDHVHRERARVAAQSAALRAVVGPVLSSPRVLASVADKQAAAASTGAVAGRTSQWISASGRRDRRRSMTGSEMIRSPRTSVRLRRNRMPWMVPHSAGSVN